MEQSKYFLAGRTMKTALAHKILHDTIFDKEKIEERCRELAEDLTKFLEELNITIWKSTILLQ